MAKYGVRPKGYQASAGISYGRRVAAVCLHGQQVKQTRRYDVFSSFGAERGAEEQQHETQAFGSVSESIVGRACHDQVAVR